VNRDPEAQRGLPPYDALGWAPGDVLFRRYKVEKVLAGGMAAIYVCRTAGDQRVVIKIPFAEMERVWQPEHFGIEAVLAELATWLGLPPHPHVVTLLDAVTFPFLEFMDEFRFSRHRFSLTGLLLDYAGEHNLREHTKAKPHLPSSDRLRLLAQVALGMEHASRHGVTPHLDLKPENVMVDEGDIARITDFGLARIGHWQHAASRLSTDARVTQSYVVNESWVAGTPAYMAPEQWCDIRQCDQRTDIYAFGILAFELMTGSHPFENVLRQNPVMLPKCHHEVEPEFSSLLCDPLTRDLIVACLAKQPAQRIQGWTELLENMPGEVVASVRESMARIRVEHRPPAQAIRLGLYYPLLTGQALQAGHGGRTATDIEVTDALARRRFRRALVLAGRGLAKGRPPSWWVTRQLVQQATLAGIGCVAMVVLRWKRTSAVVILGILVLLAEVTPSIFPSTRALMWTFLIVTWAAWVFLMLGRQRVRCPSCGGRPKRCHPLFRLDIVSAWGRIGQQNVAEVWQCHGCGYVRARSTTRSFPRRVWVRYETFPFLGVETVLARPIWRRARGRGLRFGCSSQGPAGEFPRIP